MKRLPFATLGTLEVHYLVWEEAGDGLPSNKF